MKFPRLKYHRLWAEELGYTHSASRPNARYIVTARTLVHAPGNSTQCKSKDELECSTGGRPFPLQRNTPGQDSRWGDWLNGAQRCGRPVEYKPGSDQ
jgi:hypothetical protein